MTDHCTDQRLGDMLYAYELGTLSEDDAREFELHLLRCRFCNERAQRFVDTAELLQYDEDVIRATEQLVADSECEEPELEEEEETESKRSLWRVLIPSIAAAAVLVLLVFGGWELDFRPGQEAIAAEDKLVVMYFNNLAEPDDPSRLGEIITALLITDLSESQHIQVVSDQRLYDVLKLIGHEGVKTVDEGLATQVAERAMANWFLTGSILQTEPELIIASQVVETATGNVVGTQEIRGEPGEGIFSLVDDLTIEIKEDLSFPLEFRDEPDPLVASVTTSNLEAYRNYLEAREFYYQAYFKECVARLRRALELDPTFAMAYAQLAAVMWLERDAQTADMVAMAVKNIDRATQKERWWIRSLEAATSGDYQASADFLEKIVTRYPDGKAAYFHLAWLHRNKLGEPEQSIEALRKAIEIDPQFKMAYGALGRAYDMVGDYENAMRAYNQYIALAPEEAHPYTRIALYLAKQGKVVEAIDSYEKALSRRPDFDVAFQGVAPLYLYQRNYDRAMECFRGLSQSPSKGIRSDARTGMALIPLCQGKLLEALSVLEDGIGADRLEGATHGEDGDRAFKNLLKGWIYLELGDYERAMAGFDIFMDMVPTYEPDSKTGGRLRVMDLLLEYGYTDEARPLFQSLMGDLEGDEYEPIYQNWGDGMFAMSRGDAAAAAKALERLPDYRSYTGHEHWYGLALLELGEYDKAAETFQKLTNCHDIMCFYDVLRAARWHFYHGVALEGLGEYEAAIEKYETFLDIWSEADPGIFEEIEDARERMNRLIDRRS